MTQESKVITGSGTFKTQWGYNSADMVNSMTYPGDNNNNNTYAGEVVSYSYLKQMLVDSVSGTSIYVQHTDYDAAGRVDLRKLGADTLRTDYVYYAWNTQGGRLQYLKTGTPSNTTSMQSFTYTYDESGNVKTTLDAKNSNQKQCFLYDSLDRLTRGTTQLSDAFCQATHIGNGQYDESYAYSTTTGNLSSKGGQTLSYGDTNHKHATTAWNGWTYTYDANGNMVTRAYGGTTYSLTYDAENRLTGMTGGGVSASFVYDGDGNRVKGTVGTITTTYIGNYLEYSTSGIVKYYYAGSVRVAMRDTSGLLKFLLGDHLGSTSITTDSNGNNPINLWYYPWGGQRYASGSSPTTFRYTGQRLESDLGLYFYNARWYDSYLNRWIQPDSIIPSIGEGNTPNGIGYDPQGNVQKVVGDDRLEQITSDYIGITLLQMVIY
jgi:RHS repeat-associated protein